MSLKLVGAVVIIGVYVFAQTVPAPTDLVTLQWIIITVLAGVVAYQYRHSRKEEKRHNNAEAALVKKIFEGFNESNNTIRGLADGIEAILSQFSILKEIENLRAEINDTPKKNT